jgi:spermidine/putrescine transport system permease protein
MSAKMKKRIAGLPRETNQIAEMPWLLSVLAYGLPIFFILIPLLSFLAYSFFWVEGTDVHHGWQDLTLLNYARIVTDGIYLPVLWRTAVLCLEVAILAVMFGYPVAYFLASLVGRKKYVFLMLLLVPLLMSYVIKIYAIRSILGGNGFLNRFLMATGIVQEPLTIFVFNLNAVLLALTVLLIPFAVLPIFLSLEKLPRNLLDASFDLGATELQTFLRVVLPLSLPGVIAAASFVFVLAIGDFLTPQMVGGNSGFTFGRIVYSQFGTAYNWPFGSALSVLLCALVIVAILIGNRFGSKRGLA